MYKSIVRYCTVRQWSPLKPSTLNDSSYVYYYFNILTVTVDSLLTDPALTAA